MILFERSGWTWETSGSGGFSVDVVAMTGGVMKLWNAQHNEEVFHYGGIGGGISTPGLKVPKVGGLIGRLFSSKMLNASGAGTELWNTGVVFKTGAVGDRELIRSDFQGACIMADIGISLPDQGRTGCAFIVGMDPAVFELVDPWKAGPALLKGTAIVPKAVIFSFGDSRGLVAGGNAYLGYLG